MPRTTTSPRSWILAVLVAAATTAVHVNALQVQPTAPVGQAPPRDPAPAAVKTAAITGRVTNLDTGLPLRRVRIQIASSVLPSAKTVSTNSDGRYEIRDLPAGEYSLRAERGGYLTLAYGQRRPGEPGKPLKLAEGQTAKAVDFALPRVAVISGRVVDETGEPIAHVNMWAMQYRYYQGARRLVPAGGVDGHTSTDDSGAYRLNGLPPGEFLVMGQIRETWPREEDPTQIFSYPPSFYPGVIAPAAAQRIKVGVGQEVSNVDFALSPERISRVSGTVVNAAGTPVAGESVTLSQLVGGPELMSIFPSTDTTRTGPDGRFSVTNVQAGEYVLAVRTAAVNDQPAQEARQMIQVAGDDIDSLLIVIGSGGAVRGRVASDDGTPVPGLEELVVRAQPLTWAARMSTLGGPDSGRVKADGTFEVKGLLGPVVLSIRPLTGDWTLKGVELEGRDLADDPIEVRHGEMKEGVRVVLTNRPTHVRGALLDDKQQPAEGTVVIFPEDTSRWREHSRTVRSARPDQHGEFSIKGLPAGKYLIAAVDYVQDGQWYDPEFLAELRPRADRLSLADGESKRLDLTVKK